MIHDSTIDLKDTSPNGMAADSPSAATCFVCGGDCRDGWFARMSTGHRMVFLCSAVCARMFFEVEPPPAHDHRARHKFQRARVAILEAARSIDGSAFMNIRRGALGNMSSKSVEVLSP